MSKPIQVYQTADIVVTFDPNLCMHFAECLRGNPQVFKLERHPWIDPAAATPDAVAGVVARCPSGALQALLPGLAPGKPLPSAGVSLAATRNGPLVVKGPVQLEHPTGSVEKRSGAFTLCRCGQTANTPFCDGSHVRTGFQSPRVPQP
jgi:uncharacterized Fe-S cluster protein YjdI/CDGSH-type Zn-finger protein